MRKPIDKIADMEAFDSFPPSLRREIRDSRLIINCVALRDLLSTTQQRIYHVRKVNKDPDPPSMEWQIQTAAR